MAGSVHRASRTPTIRLRSSHRSGPNGDEIQLNAHTRGAEVVDANHRARRLPVSEVLAPYLVHGIGLADVRQVFRGLDDVPPGQPAGVEDELNVV